MVGQHAPQNLSIDRLAAKWNAAGAAADQIVTRRSALEGGPLA
jgi:hypothetical protein